MSLLFDVYPDEGPCQPWATYEKLEPDALPKLQAKIKALKAMKAMQVLQAEGGDEEIEEALKSVDKMAEAPLAEIKRDESVRAMHSSILKWPCEEVDPFVFTTSEEIEARTTRSVNDESTERVSSLGFKPREKTICSEHLGIAHLGRGSGGEH